MSLISDTILLHLPGKRKQTPSGWISFNAVCCDDKRQRGGLIFNAGDAVSYHCFNCGFKASWQPGRPLSQKMKKFCRDLNMADDTISQLGLEALRLNETSTTQITSVIPKFEARALPIDSVPINSLLDSIPDKLVPILEYLANRNLCLDDYNFYWTPKIGFSNRVIIPFLKDNVIVGYTARAIGDAKPKYISEQQPGYVFNLDNQHDSREFVIVCEGPFDAISINGCAILGAEIKESQNWLLKQLGKEIVLVPDRDHEGPKTVEQAIEFGWSVSMPEWPEGIKDVNDAVVKIGRLATLWLIANAKESNTLKIQLRAKKWFKEKDEETN
jgi:hypothetical protein